MPEQENFDQQLSLNSTTQQDISVHTNTIVSLQTKMLTLRPLLKLTLFGVMMSLKLTQPGCYCCLLSPLCLLLFWLSLTNTESELETSPNTLYLLIFWLCLTNTESELETSPNNLYLLVFWLCLTNTESESERNTNTKCLTNIEIQNEKQIQTPCNAGQRQEQAYHSPNT